MSDNLLPCPFCGGTDLDPLANCVGCLDCGARGPTQEQIEILCDPDFAKEQWNRRALPATDARTPCPYGHQTYSDECCGGFCNMEDKSDPKP